MSYHIRIISGGISREGRLLSHSFMNGSFSF
jgi:hypothetical protein